MNIKDLQDSNREAIEKRKKKKKKRGTCIINKTSTRNSVSRVIRSRGLAGTSNAAFKKSPATALGFHEMKD